ncbi:MAG: hypothetical protein CM15mP21_8400 [Hyphomicrobiales bacterium]|nr:MAG: hypothetical protein CM15mP21_8400 [Hyphomicrobiales bacterium]
MFGQTLESIPSFDPKPSAAKNNATDFLFPAGEIHLNDEAVSRFRRGYTATFGAVTEQTPLGKPSARARAIRSMEHWLPFCL